MPRHDDYEERFADLAQLAYRVAFRLTGDRSTAEDTAQEALARAYVRWPRIRGYAEAWVVRVSTNLVIGRWRRRQPTLAPVPDSPGIDAQLDERLALVAALRTLPRRQREVLALRYLGDLSIEQTAAQLGCTESTVKAHAARALRAMRARLDGQSGDRPRSGTPAIGLALIDTMEDPS
jgi:RNA polymerase sigma-70 factor (sigma-E family)